MFQGLMALIDTRSFSSLWYWIALIVLWGRSTHWTMGVPAGLIEAARRHPAAAPELIEAARVGQARMARILHDGGMALALIVPFVLTVLLVLGFAYGVELAQALFLIALPQVLVWLLTLRAARRLGPVALPAGHPHPSEAADPAPTDSEDPQAQVRTQVLSVLLWLRLRVQILSILAIIVTALWGMGHNLRAALAAIGA